jgi:hypothetical protein
MGSYLEEFGVKDAKRERLINRIVLTLLATVIAGGVLWFLFRNFREESRVKEFIAALERKDYKAAHALWGCTDATPCRDYGMTQFLEDWGEKAGTVTRSGVKSCEGGIIQTVTVKGKETLLYVDRETLLIGFSPWPVCTPRVKM